MPYQHRLHFTHVAHTGDKFFSVHGKPIFFITALKRGSSRMGSKTRERPCFQAIVLGWNPWTCGAASVLPPESEQAGGRL